MASVRYDILQLSDKFDFKGKETQQNPTLFREFLPYVGFHNTNPVY
jgi:hypothetical protein